MSSHTPEEIEYWVKSHKSEITNSIIDSFEPSSTPVAIFMAGLPGAGKTEFLNHLKLKDDNFVKIDLDDLVCKIPGYEPRHYYTYRNPTNILVAALLDKTIKRQVSFAMDGTFAHQQGFDNVKRTLKHHFQTIIFFIDQTPEKSWHNTQARQLITERPVDRDGFLKARSNIIPNLQKTLSTFKDNPLFSMQIIQKEASLKRYNYINSPQEVDDLLSKLYNVYKQG